MNSRLRFHPLTVAICAHLYGMQNARVRWMIEWNLQA